jgi:hypothetical protein
MVGYRADDTERALRRRVPPAATPLGLAILRAGCRWFKDWYFPEGGHEGGTKLQGTLPLDEQPRSQAEEELAAELRAFLDRGDAEEADAARAREALGLLEVSARRPVSRRGRPDVPNKARCKASGQQMEGDGADDARGCVRNRHAGMRSFVAWLDTR